MPSSWTRPPIAEQDEQVLHANVVAVVEVGGAIALRRARPPGAQQDEQVLHADVAAVVEVPRAGRGIKEVGRAGAGAVVVVENGRDDGGGAADRDGEAEPVARRAVVGQQFGDLPARGGIKQVRGAGEAAVVVVAVGPDDGGGPRDRNGDAEDVVGRAVVGQELGNLPARGGVEEVGGAGPIAVVVVEIGPDDGGGPGDRDGEAEDVLRRPVVGKELGDLPARGDV